MFRTRLIRATQQSLLPAVKTAMWMIKLMIPITFGIAYLNYFGVIGWISDQLAPIFALVGLPGKSGLVFLTSALGNLYSAIAVMATIGFSFRDVTILSVVCLVCHNLIIETAIQRKTAATASTMVILRIFCSLLIAAFLNWLLPENLTGRLFLPVAESAPTSLIEVFTFWATTITPLTVKMLFIIISLNIVQSVLREFKILTLLTLPLRPFMAIFGLPRSTSFLWIICNVVGLAYGGAALVDEMNRGEVTRSDARLLNTHVALSHSMLEDTILFGSIGIAIPLLILPRLLMAIAAVWIKKLYDRWLHRLIAA